MAREVNCQRPRSSSAEGEWLEQSCRALQRADSLPRARDACEAAIVLTFKVSEPAATGAWQRAEVPVVGPTGSRPPVRYTGRAVSTVDFPVGCRLKQ